jgi:hypothetical protein
MTTYGKSTGNMKQQDGNQDPLLQTIIDSGNVFTTVKTYSVTCSQDLRKASEKIEMETKRNNNNVH